ncbi:MAG: hypothetical protein ACFE96_18305, partial [Candidatus Hermodarchaeota archaeon]
MKDSSLNYLRERFQNTLIEIADLVRKNSESIDNSQILKLIELIALINSNNGMIFVYGAGRSGFVGRCFAQRLMHLGINSCFVSDVVTYPYTKDDLPIVGYVEGIEGFIMAAGH